MLKHELLQFLLEATCWTTSCFQFKIARKDTDYSYSAPYNYIFEFRGIWCVKRDRIMTRTVKYVRNSQRDNSDPTYTLREKNEETYLDYRYI